MCEKMEYVTSFRVRAEPNKVYDLTESHFQSLGWTVEKGNKPRELILKRGTVWGTFASFDIKRVKLKLNVFIYDVEGETTVKCQYQTSSARGWFSEREKNDLNAEINALKNLISASVPQLPQQPVQPQLQTQPPTTPQPIEAICPKCGKAVSPEFAICPYCGAKLKEVKPKCHNCGKEVSPEFKVCPYCGSQL